MIKRRTLVQGVIAAAGVSLLPTAAANNLPAGLQTSDLVYLTTIRSNGKESSCQSEIWFVWDGSVIYVCTDTTAWRVQAAAAGLNRTRIWVGDLGNWKNTDGAYRNLPELEAGSRIIKDIAVHKRALEMFGDKYPFGWLRWGSAFRDGLADGSRTLLSYQPQAI